MKNYNESILKNGLQVITSEDANSSIITITLGVKAGSRYEQPHQLGHSHILEHMLLKGTKKRPTIFEMNVEQNRVGAYSNASTGSERMNMIIQVATEHMEHMMELLSDMLQNSIFDEQVLENEKRVIIEELHRAEQDPERLASMINMQNLFSGHPLSNLPIGTEEMIKKATREEVCQFYNSLYRPSQAVLITVGNLSHEKALILGEKYFGSWKTATKEVGKAVDTAKFVFPQGKIVQTFPNIKQSTLILNYPAAYVSAGEIAVLDILANFLTFGHSSFLGQELRHKRGLVYAVNTSNIAYSDAGRFSITAQTTKPKEVITIIKESMSVIMNHLPESLFHEIKNQTIGVFIRRNADPFNETSFLGMNVGLFNRLVTPQEYIKNLRTVSYGDLKKVVKKYITQNKTFLTVVGPQEAVEFE
ncbi:MAG: pitrilysin family protein [Patescibacteria group bacterium]